MAFSCSLFAKKPRHRCSAWSKTVSEFTPFRLFHVFRRKNVCMRIKTKKGKFIPTTFYIKKYSLFFKTYNYPCCTEMFV